MRADPRQQQLAKPQRSPACRPQRDQPPQAAPPGKVCLARPMIGDVEQIVGERVECRSRGRGPHSAPVEHHAAKLFPQQPGEQELAFPRLGQAVQQQQWWPFTERLSREDRARAFERPGGRGLGDPPDNVVPEQGGRTRRRRSPVGEGAGGRTGEVSGSRLHYASTCRSVAMSNSWALRESGHSRS